MSGLIYLASLVGVIVVAIWYIQQEGSSDPGRSGIIAIKKEEPAKPPKKKRRKADWPWHDQKK